MCAAEERALDPVGVKMYELLVHVSHLIADCPLAYVAREFGEKEDQKMTIVVHKMPQ